MYLVITAGRHLSRAQYFWESYCLFSHVATVQRGTGMGADQNEGSHFKGQYACFLLLCPYFKG